MARLIALAAASLFIAAIALPAHSAPLGADFTYQGRLNQSGMPLNGTADFQFRLFDAASGGAQVGTTQSANNVTITDGLFTASLNFGTGVFTGEARWLEIAVRSPAGSGTFTTLATRQSLAAAPYALYALGGPGGGTWSVNGTHISNTNSGNVGIGTTTPESRLDVRGQVSSQIASGNSTNFEMKKIGPMSATNVSFALSHRSNGTEGWMYGFDGTTFKNFQSWDYPSNQVRFPPTGGTLALDLSSNRVGIGTTTPNGGLHVVREPLTNGGTLTLEGATHTYMSFFPDGAAAGRKAFFGYSSAGTSDMTLWNEISGGNINLITTAGGATKVNVLEITGADLAEKFPTSEDVDPGMVVAIDPDEAGKMCLATGAYNRAVAGVVSGANDFSAGAILGNLPGHEDAPPVALSGRVYVWCDATSGAIQPGDLLTTSEVPGHAMKATDAARTSGAVLGKAMSRLDSGRGLVLVLVSLQ